MLLLTGATGLLGHAVVRRLIARGTPVRCLVRDPRRLGPERVRVQLAIGDLADPASWRNALRGVDTVVHLAGGARDQARATVEELNGLAAWRLLRAAERVGARALRVDHAARAPRRTTRCACSGRRRSPATAIAEADDPDHHARALAHLRARRPPPALDRAARLPARGAAGRAAGSPARSRSGPRTWPTCVLAALDAPADGHAASSWPARRRSPSARSSGSCSPRPGGAGARSRSRWPGCGPRCAPRRRSPARPRCITWDEAQLLAVEMLSARGTADADGARRHAAKRMASDSGRRCAQGCATSSCAASCSSRSSASGLPTICTPVGQPVGAEADRHRDRGLAGDVEQRRVGREVRRSG